MNEEKGQCKKGKGETNGKNKIEKENEKGKG